jgi:hypothetical protein
MRRKSRVHLNVTACTLAASDAARCLDGFSFCIGRKVEALVIVENRWHEKVDPRSRMALS